MRTETAILHTVGLEKVGTVNHKDGNMWDCEHQPGKDLNRETVQCTESFPVLKCFFFFYFFSKTTTDSSLLYSDDLVYKSLVTLAFQEKSITPVHSNTLYYEPNRQLPGKTQRTVLRHFNYASGEAITHHKPLMQCLLGC